MSQLEILTKLLLDEKYAEIINSGIKNATFDMTHLNAENIFTNNELVKYFIDNNIDTLNCSNNWRLIHYVCKYSTDKMIKYILDTYRENGFNIGPTSKNGWLPIHLICIRNSPEMIKYVLDIYLEMNYRIDSTTNDGFAPIHFICSYAPNTPEGISLVKYIFNIYKEHNLNEKQKTYAQLTPMWYYEMSDKSVSDLCNS